MTVLHFFNATPTKIALTTNFASAINPFHDGQRCHPHTMYFCLLRLYLIKMIRPYTISAIVTRPSRKNQQEFYTFYTIIHPD
jgi:hypothetical protein